MSLAIDVIIRGVQTFNYVLKRHIEIKKYWAVALESCFFPNLLKKEVATLLVFNVANFSLDMNELFIVHAILKTKNISYIRISFFCLFSRKHNVCYLDITGSHYLESEYVVVMRSQI